MSLSILFIVFTLNSILDEDVTATLFQFFLLYSCWKREDHDGCNIFAFNSFYCIHDRVVGLHGGRLRVHFQFFLLYSAGSRTSTSKPTVQPFNSFYCIRSCQPCSRLHETLKPFNSFYCILCVSFDLFSLIFFIMQRFLSFALIKR